MAKTGLQKYAIYITFFSAVLTIIMMIYAAQPWGSNYAFQNSIGYGMLAIFIGWAVSPYIGILILMHREIPVNKGLKVYLFIGISLFCIASVAIIFDTVFIHIDAQGGLIFFFLPIYQWVALALSAFIYYLAKVIIFR